MSAGSHRPRRRRPVEDFVADLLQEVLHPGRRDDRQHAHVAPAFVVERVQQVLGDVDEGARPRDRASAIRVESQLAFENVEGLILPPVKVGRRSPVGRNQTLEERIRSPRVNTSVLEEVVIAGRPDALSFPWLDNFYLQHWPCSLSNQRDVLVRFLRFAFRPRASYLCASRSPISTASGGPTKTWLCLARDLVDDVLLGGLCRPAVRVQLGHELVEAARRKVAHGPGDRCPPSGWRTCGRRPSGCTGSRPDRASTISSPTFTVSTPSSTWKVSCWREWICRGGPSRYPP